MNEDESLIYGWMICYSAAFGLAFAIPMGFTALIVTFAILLACGVLTLATSFIHYQWGSRTEYIQYWHDMIWMHMPPKKEKKPSTR